ncbi:MAG: PKD domain-containing protein, partial [Bacteroidales bacterium]|nr:PKD domain-containing protein [Bacteroidales bacterium]
MNNLTFYISMVGVVLYLSGNTFAQETVYPTTVYTPVYFDVYGPLSELPPITAEEFAEMEKDAFKARNEDLKYRSYPYEATALPKGPDEVWQKQMGETAGKAPLLNFAGQNSPYYPPDCNGDVGPSHFFQGVNTTYAIYSKTGSTLVSSTAYNTLFSGVTGSTYNDGDPIILYDEQADRWMAAEFSISGSNDYMLIAVSTSGNPTGTWYRWSFDVANMPDYMKFGVWRDGYYMATNTSGGNDVYVFNRSVMLTGGASPQMIGFDNPWRPTTIDGFHCIQPLDNDGDFAPTGSPGLFITMNDDAIGGGSDQLWVYELTANWATPSSSTFTRVQQLNVSAFDSNFGTNWDNIKQPGTTRELDAIPGVLMYRAQYRNFGSSQHIVCCHTVDVSASDHAGIRWYELIKTGTTWSVRQQGTYAPDAHSRWMGSIAMNGNHEIGLGYSISSTSVYPGIRYCGQSATANASATGTLDVAEDIIWTGTNSQTAYNRWGDYSLISVDPSDDHTFWFTSQYINTSGGRATRIASFQFAAPALNANFSGTPTTVCAGGTVTFTDLSTGSPTTWNWSFPGGTPSSYVGQNPPSITYNTAGSYNVSLTVGNGTTTDTETKTGYITVTSIIADFSGSPTTVVVGNSVTFTDNSSCGPTSWSWSFPGGNPSTYSGQNPPAITYNTVGAYNVSLTVTGPGGSDTETKTNYINVINCTYCASTYTNTTRDWITNVTFNTINNTSGQGGSDSYEDFTAISTSVTPGNSYPVSVAIHVINTSRTQHCIVFFDWNQDCDFTDAGESFDLGQTSGTGTLSSTVAVPAGALSGATRMRVAERYNLNPGPCDVATYGEVEDYTVIVSAGMPPSCTNPVAPANGATNVALNTTLSWSAASGATGYYLYFGTNNPPTNIVNGTNLGNVTSYTPNPALNPGTIYYWRVVPFNTSGSATGCSVWSFTTGSAPSCATPVAPANGATGVSVNTTLTWNAVSGATGYYIYFGTNNPPTNIANGANLGNVTSYTPPAVLNYYTAYFWRIVPYNSFGSATGCSVWQFVTEQALPPSCTTPVTPANGAANVTLNTALSWNAAAGATGYYLYFGTDNPPTNIVNGANLGNVTSYTPNPALNTGTAYFWRIVPYNIHGSAAGCIVWSFTTGSAPSCTTPVAPVNGGTGVSVSTTLTWAAAAGATGYYIYFGTNNPPTNIANGINLGNVTSYTPPATLNNNTAYFWTIVPYNSFGTAMGCSVWFFVTESSGLDLRIVVFLEGPFNPASGLMLPDLNPGQLPLSQPYNTTPWNYTGSESVASLPNLNVVDWVLVELRDAANASSATSATMIARQAAFLLNNGSVVGMDGTSDLNFNVSLNNQLFVVIWHRNHLGIMTSGAVSLDAGVYTYNFSTSATQV